MKKFLSAVSALLFSATIASASCTQFEAAGSGQNVTNYCDYSVIISWRSTDGPCAQGVMCGAVVGANSWQSTSNPYYSGVTWYECVYQDWINGDCSLPN